MLAELSKANHPNFVEVARAYARMQALNDEVRSGTDPNPWDDKAWRTD
ncbi:MAG: hypothetical protein R3C68_07150 [Myxococcota bacterium]